MKYLGHLSKKDSFYGYLAYDILPQLGGNGGSLDFRFCPTIAEDAQCLCIMHIFDSK